MLAIINDTHIKREFCPFCEQKLDLQKDPFEHSGTKVIRGLAQSLFVLL